MTAVREMYCSVGGRWAMQCTGSYNEWALNMSAREGRLALMCPARVSGLFRRASFN